MKTMRVLFVGNSHTFVNNIPYLVKTLATKNEKPLEFTHLGNGGASLSEHAQSDQLHINLKFGDYDCIFIQEHTHPFPEVQEFAASAGKIIDMEKSVEPFLYLTWAEKERPEDQRHLTKAFLDVAKEKSAEICFAGEAFWDMINTYPQVELFASDGKHTNPNGAFLVAIMMYKTLFFRLPHSLVTEFKDANGELLFEIDNDVAQKILEICKKDFNVRS